MYLTRLHLSEFRSWARLDLTLEPGLTLISGPNAAGKSNLIEAIYLLAALRSTRASVEGELIRWDAEEPQTMRIAGTATTGHGEVEVEVALGARPGTAGSGARARTGAPLTSKRIRINGVARRAADALGAIRAVQFTTLDLELLTGPSALRRRYLDVAIGQLQPGYATSLTRYQRTLQQRNALLKRITSGQARSAELEQWDDLLTSAAIPIWEARSNAIAQLAPNAARRHANLLDTSDSAERLSLRYVPAATPVAYSDGWETLLRQSLTSGRNRDLARGATQIGPHRDDVAIDLNSRPAAAFASRAQQRACALALRLAEADYLETESGEAAILLLDDIFSEMDPDRRDRTAAALDGADQLILTTADIASLPETMPGLSASWVIDRGELKRARN